MRTGGTAGEPDPDELLAALRDAAGPPALPPLTLAEPAPSARTGLVGVAVGAARRGVLRLIVPALADLLSQLERDRHRHRAEIARLERRVADLEREVAEQDPGPGGRRAEPRRAPRRGPSA